MAIGKTADKINLPCPQPWTHMGLSLGAITNISPYLQLCGKGLVSVLTGTGLVGGNDEVNAPFSVY